MVSAIYGLGGIGKSVLAAALADDSEIQAQFPDGTLWITLGQNPDLLRMLGGWIRALGDYKYQPLSPEEASSHLRTLLYDRQMLLIVDDVWNPVHLEPFQVGNQNSCVLVTTRGAPISGAQKYDLDVMTPDQAMGLLTHQVSTPLTPDEQQQATAFAKRVGYLPLALELATAQVEEGLSWKELLSDYQNEVERLEILDTVPKDDIPDDEKRRKHSLIACFNLSLKSLTPDQQTYFAWLGVLPEDADITKRMAKTLWQLTERQTGNVLKAFRTKGLLKGERPTYRLHDLMHDLAVQLLSAPEQPAADSCTGETLPGLGKNLADAHQHFLALYQQQTREDLWHTLTDDGHIYDYLTWHMLQAECPDLIHRLFQEITEKGGNGWHEACEQAGKPALFASDLARAWKLTLNNPLQANELIPLQVRYAFIRASLNSLADNIPAAMVGGLLKVGLWQPAQALAYAQQTYNPWRRAEYLMALTPHMPRPLLPEVLTLLNQINAPAYSSIVLSKLAPDFPELWPNVLKTIDQIRDVIGFFSRHDANGFSYRSLALTKILSDLPANYLSDAIDITRNIQDDSDCASVLREMAQYLPEHLWDSAIDITRNIQDDSDRASVLREMAQYLPEHLWDSAIDITRNIQSDSDRASALSAMAQYLPEHLWDSAIDITRNIQDDSDRASALSAMAQHLPEHLWDSAIDITRNIQSDSYRASALREMAQHLPELWDTAIDITRNIQSDSYRAR
ncbi:MAG: NB-ARC domain-containing protein, partial [Cyanobacteria bacterium P01_A01_bin.15]